ncbi:DUF2798 domain-containing protein [Ruegeria jejuensis]|uniref:DUF2798 domain-containing protein n=1 Tax=Ruegeria jejuensis TaxID=3233338 RepID=UPI00355C6397
MSYFMTLLISGVTTFLAIGFTPVFVPTWLSAWLSSWAIAFPTVLTVAPVVRCILHRFVVTVAV